MVCIPEISSSHINAGIEYHVFLSAVNGQTNLCKLFLLLEAQFIQAVYIFIFDRAVCVVYMDCAKMGSSVFMDF